MLAKIQSCTVLGIEGWLIQVEVDVAPGLPTFSTVGLPDSSVRESKDRVKAAIKNCGYDYPPRRITVNLAPADIRKEGAGFDLPIAVGILEASRDVTQRIRLEREVERSKTLFQKVIESTVDGIVMVDPKGNVLIFNEGMERLTGYSAEEIMTKGHLSSFYDINTAKENMKKMRSDDFGPLGKLNPTSMSIITKDGKEIPVTLSASIVTIDEKEVGSVGVFRDISRAASR